MNHLESILADRAQIREENEQLKVINTTLLEALKELVEEITICQECGSLTDKHYITDEPLKYATNAIAQAEGKTV